MSLSEGNAKTGLEQSPVTYSPRPVGLIRAHSPRPVNPSNPLNPFNPSYPSKSMFKKKKLYAIMVCPIRSRSLVNMWGDNIGAVLII